jgi:RNA polymerase sigma-70 factor, ECF subfamily
MTPRSPIPTQREPGDRRTGSPALHLVGTASDSPSVSDREIVLGIVAGKRWAQDAAFHRYAAMISRFVCGVLGSAQDAHDLTQEVFLGLYSRAASIRQPEALKAFLFSAALRQVHSELRRRRVRRWVGLSATGDPPEVPTQGADFVVRQMLRRYYGILDTLDARDRSMFVLRHIEGFTLEEIASATRTSLATVKRYLARASAQVSEQVDGDAELRQWIESIGGHDAN